MQVNFPTWKRNEKSDTMKTKCKVIKPVFWVVIHPHTHARLCKDGLLREHANFGTFPSCVKTFRYEGWATRAAEKYLGYEWEIRGVHKGETMDAAGNIYNEEGTRDIHRCLNTAINRRSNTSLSHLEND